MLIFLALFSALYILFILWTLRGVRNMPSNLEEFFVASRNIGLWRAIATIGATEIGLITIAYNAQKGFNQGFSAFHIGIAALVGCLIVGLTGFVVKPLRRTGVLTIPEFYEQRFSRSVRVFGALIMALGGILNMGLFLKVASIMLVAMLPLEGIISPNMLMVILIAIAVFYTAYGGMRTVIATDVFQFIILAGGLFAAAFFLLGKIPLESAITIVESEKGPGGLNPVVNADFGISYILWMILVAGIVSASIWPTALSRALCIENEKTVQRAYLFSALIFCGRMILPAFLGVMAFVYFSAPLDQAAGEALKRFGDDSDLAATALMLGQAMPPWLVAFLGVAFFASFMSTQDGYLFCWASIIARDIIGPLTGKTDHVEFQKKATRILIIVIALYELYWGLIYSGREDIWDYIAVSGSIYFCSGIVLLAGGLYWRRATSRGALWALVLGFSAVAALGPVKQFLGLENISSPLIGFGAIGLSLLGFIIGSYLSPAPRQEAKQV